MSPLLVAEVLLLAGCVIIVLWLAALWVRRRSIGTSGTVALCAVRHPGAPRWRLGLLRLGAQDLAWFGVTGITSRPSLVWPREDLEISTPREEDVSVPGLERPVSIVLTGRRGHLGDLAVERPVYFSLRSWLESAPPGHGVDLA